MLPFYPLAFVASQKNCGRPENIDIGGIQEAGVTEKLL
jgi:hypothetical protein